MTKYLTNNFSIINLYKNPSNKSEIVTQMIYGDSFLITKKTKKWLKVKINEDNYKGYVINKNFSHYLKPSHKIAILKAKIYKFPNKSIEISSLTFGSKIKVGNVTDIEARIDAANGFLYVPEGRMWVTKYPAGSIKKAEAAYSGPELGGMRGGLVALYQKCPHLGCRVPECQTSQWFECPCHGSQYNRVGEKRGGPAPRGMDRFAMEVKDGVFIVDTGTIIQGPPIGTNTTGQEAEGPNCIGQSDH